MGKLINELEKLFDKYHKKQLEINNKQDPEYYLFMGKADGISEALKLIDKYR